MTRKELSFLLWMALLIVIVALMSSCGPTYHLKRAKHHWNKAIEKGATTTVDTTWQTIPVITPAINFSTTIRPDWTKLEVTKFTVEDEKTGANTNVTVGLREDCPPECIEYVEIDSYCPPDTVKIKVPTAVHMEAKSGHTTWDMVILSIFVAVIAYGVGRFTRR